MERSFVSAYISPIVLNKALSVPNSISVPPVILLVPGSLPRISDRSLLAPTKSSAYFLVIRDRSLNPGNVSGCSNKLILLKKFISF